MPRYDRNNGVRVLYPKIDKIYTNITQDIRDRFQRLSKEQGMSESEYLRLLIDIEIDKVKFYVPKN